ncbi:MAG: trypsin-like peptidase domain-containing protein [Polaromonas sp.]|nr:trypsin-like peptidase domain-containing protein [Polaromonas sp.]
MRRPALYSSSRRASHDPDGRALPGETHSDSPPGPSRLSRWFQHAASHQLTLLWAVVGLLALLLALSLAVALRPAARPLTQNDIDAAVLKTLETTRLPSPAVKAYEAIIPSVVRVVGLGKNSKTKDGKEEAERSVGTGVVIVDKGVILTNLHVVEGAHTIQVTFSDGLETTASITGVQLENDLAVLQAHTVPDDLTAATLRSTAELAPGDQVLAVGYPFGIGPSASAGVISGLQRTFRSPEGKQQIPNLIQFDAAANPGNSGGPLVTMDGEVIGIVTAIYNPNQQRTFVGIGFAVPIENAAAAAGVHPF